MYKEAKYYPEKDSGKVSEYFALGEIRQTEAYLKELKRVANERGYVSWENSFKLVRKFSPYNPTHPHQKPFLSDLRIALIDELGITAEKDMDRVKIYTAVGSPLDFWHGTDLVIEVEDGNGRTSKIIGFDVFDAHEGSEIAEKRKHVHDKKADIVIFMKDVPDAEDGKEYIAKMGEIAKKAAEVLKTKESVAM